MIPLSITISTILLVVGGGCVVENASAKSPIEKRVKGVLKISERGTMLAPIVCVAPLNNRIHEQSKATEYVNFKIYIFSYIIIKNT